MGCHAKETMAATGTGRVAYKTWISVLHYVFIYYLHHNGNPLLFAMEHCKGR